MTAKTLFADLEQKRGELAKFFADHQAEDGLKMSAEDVTEARRRNDELTDLGKKWEEARDLEEMAAQNARSHEAMKAATGTVPFSGGTGGGDRLGEPLKSLGQSFIESQAYKSWHNRLSNQSAGIEIPVIGAPGLMSLPGTREAMKATFTTSGSTFTQYDRQPGLVLLGQQRLTVADLLAQGQTTMNTIRYPQEDTFTNAATTVSEGGTKPEATWDTSEADAPVRKIAVVSKVSDEMFQDFPLIRDYINERMPFMVRQTEEAQLIGGDGIAPNILGILNVTTIQTQATGADTNPDAIYKAIVKVRTVGFFEPDAVVIHPNNWTPIRLLKTTTGEYVWGAPSEAGPERIWGLYVDVTTGITANTGLVGAFKLGGQVFYREGVRIEATNSNSDDFVKNLISIRCELREALAVYRPKAFCKVTSLGT